MRYILGIDVANEKVDVGLTETNEPIAKAEFANSAKGHKVLKKWLKKHKVEELHVCMEATGRYGDELARYLYEQGYTVSVVNPLRISHYRQSKLQQNKTDPLDALLIADFCFTQKPEPWTPPSEAQRELQELTREITTLKKDRQRKRNKLKSGIVSKPVQRSLKRAIDFIDKEIERLEQEIKKLIDSDEELKENVELLTSIPAIGITTATRFLAEVDYTGFQQAAQVAAYAGLVPTEHSSGSSVRKKPRLSKAGNRHLRTAFFMPSLSAHRYNPIVQALVQRLSEKGKEKMVIIGAVMRKLVHLAFGVLKTRKPFDPQHLQNLPVGG